VWPEENGCGGGAFTTMDEGSARNYMAGANESADAGRSACRPELVPLYDQAALDAAVAQAVAAERERWNRKPVAAQCRFPGVAWTQCDVKHARMVLAKPAEWPRYEVRLLCEWVGPNCTFTGLQGRA
jgi:hypothetical protein